MARANWLLLLAILGVSACAKRPEVVLTNRFYRVDDAASVVGVELGAYYATFVGEVGEGLDLTPVTDLAARCEDASACRVRVRDDGKVLEVTGLAEKDAVVALRYARPGSLRPEHRRVRFHFFSAPPSPVLALGAPIPPLRSSGWDLPARNGRPAMQCLKARGAPSLEKWLAIQGRKDLELFACKAKREVQPGDWRPPQHCVGLCPDNENPMVCAELQDGNVVALSAFEPTGDEATPYKVLDREGPESGRCVPAR